MAEGRRTLLLGVDAGDPGLISEWAAKGLLPFFRKLEAESAIFPVTNDDGFFVGSVWPSYATGTTPDHHHWYCYRQYDPASYRDERFSPDTLNARPFWAALGDKGVRTGVFDVPLLPVTQGLNGFQVSEWGSHDTFLGGLKTWPEDLASYLTATYGYDPVGTCDDIARSPAGYRHFSAGLKQRIETRERMISDLCHRYSPEFLFAVFSESHCAGHQAWHLHDPGHPRHDAQIAQQSGDPLLETYQAIDASVQRIIDAWGKGQVLVLLSHGIGPHYGVSYMLDEILRVLDHTPVSRSHAIWSSARLLWQKTPALFKRVLPPTQGVRSGLKDRLLSRGREKRRFFAVTNNDVFGAIRVNLEGREPNGCVSPFDYSLLLEWLTERLMALRCADTGEAVVLEVKRTAELYDGPFCSEMPDLLVRWNQALPIESVAIPGDGTVRIPYEGVRTGDHRNDGLGRLYYLNPAVAGTYPPVSNIDIAPSVASLLGVDLEGLPGRKIGTIC
jgi:predicted AlkP superfamily phosphohydrolase/phosphomutase